MRYVSELFYVNKTDIILGVAQSATTHWKYAVVANRCLRTLIRKDTSFKPSQIRYITECTYDSNASIVSSINIILSYLVDICAQRYVSDIA